MGVSTAPTVISELVNLLETSPDLSGVKVYDGPYVIPAGVSEGISVGYADESGTHAVEATADLDGLNPGRLREQYTIMCLLEVNNGGGKIPTARQRSFELLAVVGNILATRPALGGDVLNARVGSYWLTQQQARNGANAKLQFAIIVDAYQPDGYC